MLDVTF